MWSTISRLFAKPRSFSSSTVRTAEPGEEAAEEINHQYPECTHKYGEPQADLAVHVFESMDLNMGDDRRNKGPGDQQSHSAGDSEHLFEAYDVRQAKQRASVKWLLSKAYNNRVPDNLKEPYYRDLEDQEHLKPQIVHALSNAELYCLALANIYSDPNYHNQNHWGILQALARKGVYVAEPTNNSQTITETILIQNSPLKMSAHMAVIEGLMVLYAKEVVTGDRVVAAIRRFDPQAEDVEMTPPNDHEKGLLLWISHASHALIAKIQVEEGAAASQGDNKTRLPEFQPSAIKDFQSLCDGVGLAAVVAFYCPGELNWMDIRISKRPSVADALHNLSLVHNFCMKCLPYSIFHMQPEDVTYMRGSMKQNLVVFLADMYNVLEIHPVKCVRYPGEESARQQYLDECPRNSHGVAHKRSLPQSIAPIPDLRSNLSISAPGFTVAKSSTPLTMSSVKKSQSLQQTAENYSHDERRSVGSEESFVIHRNRGIPTLSSIVTDERFSKDAVAAGRPSNWEDQRRSSYAGRRSRRNSVTDDSQLTIENFGGSQDNLHNFGCMRNPDKELTVHTGKRTATETTLPARSSVQDAYASDVQHILADNGYTNNSNNNNHNHNNSNSNNNNDHEPTPRLRRQASNSSLLLNNSTSHKNVLLQHSSDNNNDNNGADNHSGERAETVMKMASFANLTRQGSVEKSINLKYTNNDEQKQEHEEFSSKANSVPKKSGQSNSNTSNNGLIGEKKTTFATLPNTTTWQQQSTQQLEHYSGADENNGGAGNNTIMASQLNNIRMKLEEKRRHIENEKRRMEVVLSKQRQKVGKAAFLQAVSKGKVKSPSSSSTTSCSGDSPCVEHGPSTPLNTTGSPAGGDEISSNVTETPLLSSLVSSRQHNAQETKPQRPFSFKEINEDIRDVEHKWLLLEQDASSAPFIETRRTPDIENMDLEQYHQSISQMNTSLSEIQQDIQRLANQQNQIQQSQFYLHDQPPPPQSQLQRRTWGRPPSLAQQNFANELVTGIGYDPHHHPQQSIIVDPRYNNTQPPVVIYQQDPSRLYEDTRNNSSTWGSGAISSSQQKGFVLHDTSGSNAASISQEQQRYFNGGSADHLHHHSLCNNQMMMHQSVANYPNVSIFNQSPSTSATAVSPQHRSAVHRISQLMNRESPEVMVKKTLSSSVHHIPLTYDESSPIEKRQNNATIHHIPVAAPPVDDMEPQNISFIGNDDHQDFAQGIKRLHITSGSRTYRIASPTKTTISRNSFQPHHPHLLRETSPSPTTPVISTPEITPLDLSLPDGGEKGFYISFDNDSAPKKPKPPTLRVKRSPKKERTASSLLIDSEDVMTTAAIRSESPASTTMEELRQRQMELTQRELVVDRQRQSEERDRELKRETDKERNREPRPMNNNSSDGRQPVAGVGLLIGNQLANPDPNSVDEMERRKERIMLLSLQRRQQQEEMKERKETEAQMRREKEKLKEEERAKKKEDDRQRRAVILEQHKLKKAIEEAEREGKVIDKELLNAIKPATAKLRHKTAITSMARPRPKTIHVDQSADLDSGVLTPSRGKKGSSSNLSTATASSTLISPTTMKRDYFRGSQDTLTSAAHFDDRRSGMFSRGGSLKVSSVDSPDDGRGYSPCRGSSTSQLGRRGSYKTSRDAQEPQQQLPRGRPKYSTYQNFKGRKSNSLMNLCDTDSGLGRATPPRRAPSPGMGSNTKQHLPSPSGPGSLPPGLMSKRRYDDGSSDISCSPSMMEYNGPRLYKQPASKSNRGIMLNAVEYCVFPGTVNKEAKRRVLDEIGRSESKHFLILFRDAGCQFRALYSFCPDREEVTKLCGTGPKQVIDNMFDKFFKYNSGGKCFSQVHTKHLTVTIDAFTIHNSLWQGKKVNLPNKKDMALVI